MNIGEIVGVQESLEPAITFNGKAFDFRLAEKAARMHLINLRCEYCREIVVRRLAEGKDFIVGERPDTSDLKRSATVAAQDKNHETWHAWTDQVRKARRAIRDRENATYAALKLKDLRGEALEAEAAKVLASLPKIVIPKLPQLLDTKPKVERPVKVRVPKPVKKVFKRDDGRAAAREASVERTLKQLEALFPSK